MKAIFKTAWPYQKDAMNLPVENLAAAIPLCNLCVSASLRALLFFFCWVVPLAGFALSPPNDIKIRAACQKIPRKISFIYMEIELAVLLNTTTANGGKVISAEYG